MAKYQTNYSQTYYQSDINNNKTVITEMIDETRCSCFSSLFGYLSNDNYIESTVFIKEEYITNNIEKPIIITEERLISWLEILKKLGLNFEYLGEVKDHKINVKYTFDKKVWSIRITKEDNNTQSIKLFLNLIRYLYEDPLPEIIDYFLKFKELIQDGDDYSLIHLANYASSCSMSGHNCFGESYIYELVDQQLLNDKFINATNNKNSYTNTLNITKKSNKIKTDFYEFRKSLSKDENVIKYYELLSTNKLELIE